MFYIIIINTKNEQSQVLIICNKVYSEYSDERKDSIGKS